MTPTNLDTLGEPSVNLNTLRVSNQNSLRVSSTNSNTISMSATNLNTLGMLPLWPSSADMNTLVMQRETDWVGHLHT